MDLELAKQLLLDEGYMIVKVPQCTRDGRHGRHNLITRSRTCPGVDPLHGYHSSHFGTFGLWINCQCGNSFSDYTFDSDPTRWEKHKEEHGIRE